MSKIMFIGAGYFQEPGIRRAKELGHFVIATDGNREAPGLKLADEAFVVDVKDKKAHLKIASQQSIDAVLSIASDACIETVASVTEEFGLAGIDSKVAECGTDKALMRDAFAKSGVPSPRFFAVHDYAELQDRAVQIGYPLVVKPADNAGSRGVQKVDDPSGLESAYKNARAYSRKQKVMVEEFMEGVEVSVEVLMSGGKMHIIAVSDKIRTQPPYLLDTHVIFPTACSVEDREKVIAVARASIDSVGITQGPVHIELMMTSEGPIPVELAARGPGFKVFTDILPIITGVDLLKAHIDVALGNLLDLTFDQKMSAAIRFFSATDGSVKDVKGIEEVKLMPGIHDIEIYVKEGDKVKSLTSGADRIGHVIATAPSREQVMKLIEEVDEKLEITFLKDNE